MSSTEQSNQGAKASTTKTEEVVARAKEMQSEIQSKKEGVASTVYDACRKGDVERIQEYVSHNGCATECDSQSLTMLHHAAFGGHVKIVSLILSLQPRQKINLDAADSSGWTALHYAVDRGFTDVVQVLLDEGATVNCRDEMNRTPLHLAAIKGNADMIRILLSNGASKTAKNVTGMTAKQYAEINGFQAVAELL